MLSLFAVTDKGRQLFRGLPHYQQSHYYGYSFFIFWSELFSDHSLTKIPVIHTIPSMLGYIKQPQGHFVPGREGMNRWNAMCLIEIIFEWLE